MLNQITLKKFRQFDEKVVVFSAGNNVLRGPNEGGKSTIIEGLLYVMGGTKCCRNSDFVQWGAKQGECKVEVLMTFHGTSVRATRGPRGAEVYIPSDAKEPAITGQSEVNAFFAEQLGAPLDVAAKMMFAGQKEIGGLLDEKNGKVVEFIEEMSGLDIIDWLITKVVTTGKTGPTQSMRDMLETETQRFEQDQASDYKPVIKAIEQQLPALEQKEAGLKAEVANAQDDLQAYQERKRAHDLAAAALASENSQAWRAADAVVSAAGLVGQANDTLAKCRSVDLIDVELERADQQRQALTERAGVGRIHKQFLAYVAPENVWEGTVESLDAEIATTDKSISEMAEERRTRQQAVKDQRQQANARRANVVEVGKKCKSCGQMIPDAAGAEEHNNAELEAAIILERGIAALESNAASMDPKIAEEQENLAALRSVRSQRTFATAEANPQLFSMDLNFYPPAVTWIGGEVKDAGPEIAALTAAAAALRIERDGVRDAQSALANAEQRQKEAEAAAHAAEARSKQAAASADLISADQVTLLDVKVTECHQTVARAQTEHGQVTSQLVEQRTSLKNAKEAQKEHAQRLQRYRDTITKLQDDIEAQEFNNELILALRRARPAVANQLWNMILKGVSTYLSNMRNEPSIVTRVDKTFMINDKPYDSYSGSALDLLALGVRIGLAKVFVPASDMLVLDEPFSACSAERTMQCLAFTAAAGFGQTIIITHEEQSSEVFDTLVEV